MMKQYQEGKCLDKTISFNRVMISVLSLLFNTIDVIANSTRWIFGEKESSDDSLKRLIPVQELTKETKEKENAEKSEKAKQCCITVCDFNRSFWMRKQTTWLLAKRLLSHRKKNFLHHGVRRI